MAKAGTQIEVPTSRHPATTAPAGECFPPVALPGRSTPMRALAVELLEDGLSALPQHDHEYFDLTDWQNAARYLLDSDETSELAWMLARDRAFNEFCEWQAEDFRHREDAEFDTWLESRARWNQPNWYQGAVRGRA